MPRNEAGDAATGFRSIRGASRRPHWRAGRRRIRPRSIACRGCASSQDPSRGRCSGETCGKDTRRRGAFPSRTSCRKVPRAKFSCARCRRFCDLRLDRRRGVGRAGQRPTAARRAGQAPDAGAARSEARARYLISRRTSHSAALLAIRAGRSSKTRPIATKAASSKSAIETPLDFGASYGPAGLHTRAPPCAHLRDSSPSLLRACRSTRPISAKCENSPVGFVGR